MDNLLEIINNCSDDELETIITKAINNAIINSQKRDMLGFCQNMNRVITHKGFIHPDTKIRYSNFTMNTYSMKTVDYFYEFARYIKKMNIKNKGSFIKYLENIINIYFGINRTGNDLRDNYFDKIAFETTKTDDEYFAKLDSLEIGDLKGKNIAMCTERAAVAQNILSLFGFESYYCMGCVNNDNKEEPHCFNIVKSKETYRLLDYSIPVPVFKNGKLVDYAPFQGNIPNEKLEDVLINNEDMVFDGYEYHITNDGLKKVAINNFRTYVVGDFNLSKNNLHHL